MRRGLNIVIDCGTEDCGRCFMGMNLRFQPPFTHNAEGCCVRPDYCCLYGKMRDGGGPFRRLPECIAAELSYERNDDDFMRQKLDRIMGFFDMTLVEMALKKPPTNQMEARLKAIIEGIKGIVEGENDL